jgi:hypothetical protein
MSKEIIAGSAFLVNLHTAMVCMFPPPPPLSPTSREYSLPQPAGALLHPKEMEKKIIGTEFPFFIKWLQTMNKMTGL